MTAPLASSSTLFNGVREFGQVTNSFAGYLQSGGVAYDIVLPWQADAFQWWRYTAFGTAGTIGQGIWFRDFPSGDELAHRAIVDNGATGLLNLVLETTNGITINNTSGGFTDEHLVISGISIATPGVVTTTTAHGLANNDRVFITKVVGSVGAIVNNEEFVVRVASSTTFSLYDTFGNPVTTTGVYTSGGQVTKEGPKLGIVNSPISYKLTLGSQVMGADNDVIYFMAWKFNNYQNIGDVA